MASKPSKPEPKAPPKESPEQTGLATRIFNGLYGAIFGSGSFPGLNFGAPGSQQVSQLEPLFSNLRWYFASNWRQQLSEAYCELGLIQTIVDTPVDDALRGGIELASKKLSPNQIDKIQEVMEREDDVMKMGQGLKWMRLFGGGALLIITDQNPALPLDTKALYGAKLAFHPVDLWELYYDAQNISEDGDEAQFNADETSQFYSYYGKRIHASRVIKLKGIIAPSFLRPRLRGWGLSVVEICVRSINQYLKGNNLIYELLDEAKIDVYGIANLTSTLLTPQGTDAVATRIAIANRQKNFQHALVMDSQDTYTQKSLTFSGLADVMREIRYGVASDLKMPLTKIFGMGAQGFNSGEDDLEVYNGMVESTVRMRARHGFIRMASLRCAQVNGIIPDDLSVSFQPLRVLTADKEQAAKKAEYDRLADALKAKAITLREFRQACNKAELLTIQLDPDSPELDPEEAGQPDSIDGETPDGDTNGDRPEEGVSDGSAKGTGEGGPEKGKLKETPQPKDLQDKKEPS